MFTKGKLNAKKAPQKKTKTHRERNNNTNNNNKGILTHQRNK